MGIRRLSLSPSPPLTIVLVSVAVLFAALDQTVVVTVLPQMMLDLKLPPTELDRAAWIVTGYLLGYTVAIPLMARLADIHGYARLFRVSLGLFALGSLSVALAPDLPWLVASRVVQALGGGATIPIGMALVTRALPAQRRALAVGLIGAAAEAGVVLGPLYGGGITALLGWRWLFWLNLPLVALLLLALRVLPGSGNREARVDYAGGLLLTGALTLLVVALSRRDLFTGASWTPYLVAAVGLLCLGGLAWIEGRVRQPLLPGLLFRSRAAASALGTKLLMGAALIIAMVTVPLMADTVLGHSSLEGGLRLMRLTGALPVGALVGGLLAYRVGPRSVTVAGLGVAAVGLFLMSRWDAGVADPGMTRHLVVAGLGFGLVIAPIFVTAMDAVPASYQATAASLVTVARMVGMALGMAALSAWGMEHFQGLTQGLLFPLPAAGEAEEAFARRLGEYQAGVTQASVDLFQNFFRGAAVLLLAAIVPALGLRGRRR
jgi:EmrB/QacA subfamily drug resistance transporter